ncbi:Vps62-related protein [Solirubrobacter phytolaccae]|uniref:Vps62-related protein n=1 Tax=Solirubrobacter phytolaccae TaxID=1404360 RepID=A0A9X3NBV5_9ACTN|nr:Vps62-related protein [Solirubrobacter phytolaccae]MDA0183568.1 Vps62-related protein [Solirubrobacter phytolaccae]
MLDTAPVVVHDAQERSPLTAVDSARPAVYTRAVPAEQGGTWRQYWLYYRYQDQDRGIVRSGRHEGDWELVQYRVEDQRIVEAVYAQHSGQERCGGEEIELRDGRPVVYASHGSHASYFHAGIRDRLWPDPNDESDGRGLATFAPVVEITRTSPAWMTKATPWGDSRASRFVPIEQDSPPGPAFQPTRWNPETFAANARDCQADCDTVGECDTPEKALTVTGIGVLLGAALLTLRRARRRRPPGDATA